ncbi:hypothetical protein NMG60_11016821 [Bertholletia excelsa]
MADTVNYPVQNNLGCGFMSAIFHRRGLWSRRTSGKPLPANCRNSSVKFVDTHNSKVQQNGSGGKTLADSAKPAKPPTKVEDKMTTNPVSSNSRPSKPVQSQNRRPSDAARSSTSSSSNGSGLRKQRNKEPSFTSGELSLAVTDHRLNGSSPMGNIMLLSHLGNLKQPVVTKAPHKVGGTLITGNIVRRPSAESPQFRTMFGGLNKLDPEMVKSMGNEKYKQGRFEDALVLYNQAISLDPNRASFHSNKSAALIGLGRLIEAVFVCREAIRLDPSYTKAYTRLATVYLRLGKAEEALHHYKKSGIETGSEDIDKAQAVNTHLVACTKAREMRDWNSLLKESKDAISSGADSAPEVYSMKVEALLGLHRHEEAYKVFQNSPGFDTDSCTQFLGNARTAYLLNIRAQVYMVVGRFEDAVAAAHQAGQLDSRSEENAAVARRARAVALSRAKGNKMFKASEFLEALMAYNEGLDYDPRNSILLCNRAACRAKLSQFEKAAEDCTAALNVRPSYSKARLRRANCKAKMERWEAAIQDYEILVEETPGNEEVIRALTEARVQLKRQRRDEV